MPTALLKFTAVPVTSPYGWRTLKKTKTLNLHEGADTANGSKYPHSAFGDGVVVASPQQEKHRVYGWFIRIKHADGIETSHHSLDGPALFKVGQRVRMGDIIGRAGTSALSASGNHVHNGLWLDGKHVDPLKYLTPGKAVTVSIREFGPIASAPGKPASSTSAPLPVLPEGNDMLLIHKITRGVARYALVGSRFWVEFSNSEVQKGEPANSFVKQVGGNSVEVSEDFWNDFKAEARR